MTKEVSPSRLRQLHHALPPPHQRLSSDGLYRSYKSGNLNLHRRQSIHNL